MLALPGIITLMVLVIVKPMEFLPALQSIPLLYIVFGLTLLAVALDLRLRLVKLRVSPLLAWAALFFVWCVVTMAVRASPYFVRNSIEIAILFSMFFTISHGVQSLRGFRAITNGVVALALFLSVVGVHQRFSPRECVKLDPSTTELVGKPDGRPCQKRIDCGTYDDFVCERIGLFGTLSVEGRVRYRGELRDPNDLALALTAMFPFTIALIQTRRSRAAVVLGAVTGLLIVLCIVFTKSRGGQLALVAALGFYVVRRFGLLGLVAFAAVGLGVYLVIAGGRHDLASSTNERLECWYEGMTMFRSSPVFGIGHRLFGEHHYLTAHNSYVLAAAEMGMPGIFLWTGLLYTAIKMQIRPVRRLAAVPEARDAYHWASAMLASLLGLLVGMFFLSFCYHSLTWIVIGLSGGVHQSIRSHDPETEVRVGLIDLVLVSVLSVGLVSGLMVYTRLNPG
jgi:O-antigen ligase